MADEADKPQEVAAEEAEEAELPFDPEAEAKKTGALGNLIIIVIALIELCFCVACLSDGMSLLSSDSDTDPLVKCRGPTCQNFTMADITKWPYGIGAHHDVMGVAWDTYSADVIGGGRTLKATMNTLSIRSYGSYAQVSDAVYVGLKNKMKMGHTQYHIQAFLDCKQMGAVGIMVSTACFAIVAAAFVQVILSGVNLSLQSANLKVVHIIVQSVILVSSIIAVGGNSAIYNRNWECDNRLFPDVRMKDSFDMNWGTYMLWVVIILAFGSPAIVLNMLYTPSAGDEGLEGGEEENEPAQD